MCERNNDTQIVKANLNSNLNISQNQYACCFPKRPRHKGPNVILESRSFRFSSMKKVDKLHTVKKTTHFEPIRNVALDYENFYDRQLSKHFGYDDYDDVEQGETFGYSGLNDEQAAEVSDCNTVNDDQLEEEPGNKHLGDIFGCTDVTHAFDDDEYALDITGLDLADEHELAEMSTCYVDNPSDVNDNESLCNESGSMDSSDDEPSDLETCDNETTGSNSDSDSSNCTSDNEPSDSDSDDEPSDSSSSSADEQSEESSSPSDYTSGG